MKRVKSKLVIKDEFLTTILKKDCFTVHTFSSTIKYQPSSYYVYAPVYDINHVLKCQTKGFVYITGRVSFKFKKSTIDTSLLRDLLINKKFQKKDWKDIYAITDNIATVTHFYKDPLTRSATGEIFTQWIENSLLHNYVSDYFFVKIQDHIAGYVTVKKQEAKYIIDLIGVHPKFQKKGIGTALLQAVISKYSDNELYVTTEATNIQAVNLYVKNGFVPHSYQPVFHKHT